MEHARRALLATTVVLAWAGASASTASASPANTTHPRPANGVAGVTRLCGPDPAYSCTTGGYAGQNTGWWGAKYGAGYASSNQYGYHNFTLYAAYRIAQNGVGNPGWSDNANGWDSKAWAAGTNVDQTPARGAVAQWNGGSAGHLGYVDNVGPGWIEVSADNFGLNVTDRWRINAGSPAWPDNFIHFKDLLSAPVEGSFVSDTSDGRVYRIAGGAPIYVSSWATVGGPQPTLPISHSQLLSLPAYPRDGTLLAASGGGVFIVAGGAPIYLSSWNVVGGAKPTVAIDEWAVANVGNPYSHLRPYPADGTFINSIQDGRVYRVAGGAPIYVSTWSAYGGSQAVVSVDKWALDRPDHPLAHLRSIPVDGTFIASAQDGRVYRVAGGAPLYVSTWSIYGGPQPTTVVDKWATDNPDNPYAHLRSYPADGTLIASVQDGRVYRLAGGAPLYVSSWAAIGGTQPATRIDKWAVDQAGNPFAHLRPRPVNGTFLNTNAGRVYRIAGGAPILVSTWNVFGGVKPSVRVDQWAVDQAGNPYAHLDRAPVNGTIVHALPSGTYWTFAGGRRARGAASAGAVDVDEAGLAPFPIVTTSTTPPPPQSNPQQPPAAHRHATLRVKLTGPERHKRMRIVLRRNGKTVASKVTRTGVAVFKVAVDGRYKVVVRRGGRLVSTAKVTLTIGHTRRLRVRL
jgi:surface antigen/uncharacterized protein YbaR (Trm112 family)